MSKLIFLKLVEPTFLVNFATRKIFYTWLVLRSMSSSAILKIFQKVSLEGKKKNMSRFIKLRKLRNYPRQAIRKYCKKRCSKLVRSKIHQWSTPMSKLQNHHLRNYQNWLFNTLILKFCQMEDIWIINISSCKRTSLKSSAFQRWMMRMSSSK